MPHDHSRHVDPITRVVVRPTVLPEKLVAKRQVCAADKIGFAEE
jgi:hypothetical protein